MASVAAEINESLFLSIPWKIGLIFHTDNLKHKANQFVEFKINDYVFKVFENSPYLGDTGLLICGCLWLFNYLCYSWMIDLPEIIWIELLLWLFLQQYDKHQGTLLAGEQPMSLKCFIEMLYIQFNSLSKENWIWMLKKVFPHFDIHLRSCTPPV